MSKILSCSLLGLFCWIQSFAENNNISTDSLTHKDKKVEFTGLPTISFDRSKGIGFGAIGMAFFKMADNQETKPSSVHLMGKYTTEGNWNVVGMTQLYFNGDKFRLAAGGGYMNSNFQTFEDISGGQMEIPYNNHGGFFFVAPSVQILDHLYVGIGGQMFKSHLDVDLPDPQPDSVSTTWMNSFAVTSMYDSKDSPYNATQGMSGVMRINAFPVWLDNTSTFYKMHLEYNYYKRIDRSKVLAARAAANLGLGNVPFVAQTYVGGRDIRGYTKGEYRGDQTYATQAELRWNFYRRWGGVGFFGLAMAHSPGDTSPLLPGGGVGVRYIVLPKYKINAGIDAAVGKDDWGVYFRITEAF